MKVKDSFFSGKFSVNCEGNLVDLSTPKIMGILNVTPDSFFDGGKNNSLQSALSQTERMISEGATFIDVGGYSSRPGASNISVEEEINRTAPIIESLKTEFPEILISIDTFRSEVAQATLNSGACMINDISGGKIDEKIYDVALKNQVPYIAMHMRGNPQNMQSNTEYKNVAADVTQELSSVAQLISERGLNDLILDPGFGFSKTLEQNYELMSGLNTLQTLNYPILVGISRKSMIYKLLETTPEQALNATSALNLVALQKGANILRVHDVKEAKEVVSLFQMLNR